MEKGNELNKYLRLIDKLSYDKNNKTDYINAIKKVMVQACNEMWGAGFDARTVDIKLALREIGTTREKEVIDRLKNLLKI